MTLAFPASPADRAIGRHTLTARKIDMPVLADVAPPTVAVSVMSRGSRSIGASFPVMVPCPVRQARHETPLIPLSHGKTAP